jgi:hypothetical protein
MPAPAERLNLRASRHNPMLKVTATPQVRGFPRYCRGLCRVSRVIGDQPVSEVDRAKFGDFLLRDSVDAPSASALATPELPQRVAGRGMPLPHRCRH